MPGREADACMAHRREQGLPTGGPDCVARFAGDAAPHPLDAPKLLGVDVQNDDRRGVLAVDGAPHRSLPRPARWNWTSLSSPTTFLTILTILTIGSDRGAWRIQTRNGD